VGWDGILKKVGYICALSQNKCPNSNYLSFSKSAYIVRSFEWDFWFVLCRKSSEVYVKCDNFK